MSIVQDRIKQLTPYLGKVTDYDIADVIPCTARTVKLYRDELGISPQSKHRSGVGSKLWHPYISEYLFDTLSDEEISTMFDVDEDVVKLRRQFFNEVLIPRKNGILFDD